MTASPPLGAREPPSLLWPIAIGLLVMYLPTYWRLATTVWTQDDSSHGFIITAAIAWLFYRERAALFAPAVQPRTLTGSMLLAFGLLAYILGRSQDILIFEVGSQLPVLIGILLIARGTHVVWAWRFALLFSLFLIPLPSFVVDALTGVLKQNVSVVVENALFFFGYPISRDGVLLNIGPYKLLVADACSGLNSMFSLSAMGAVYLFLIGHKRWLRNSILIAAILPIAFLANVVRVIFLVLVTYYFGDEAGQGFLHDFASITVFAAGLLLLLALDGLLSLVIKPKIEFEALTSFTKNSDMASKENATFRLNWFVVAILVSVMTGASAFAYIAKPTKLMAETLHREALSEEFPKKFNRWSKPQTENTMLVDPTQAEVLEYLYTETFGTSYVNKNNHSVMVSIAYGKDQSDGRSVHKPGICYPAQGFIILEQRDISLVLDSHRSIKVRYMKTQRGQRIEPLLYWTTSGDFVYQNILQRKLIGLKYSEDNLIPDGMILRVSTIEADSVVAMDNLTDFISDWYESMPEKQRSRYFGTPAP